MIDELEKIREEIRAAKQSLIKFKNKNYSQLYRSDSLRFVEQANRALIISCGAIGTMIESLNKEGYKPLPVILEAGKQNDSETESDDAQAKKQNDNDFNYE
jgi:hypothetical protein